MRVGSAKIPRGAFRVTRGAEHRRQEVLGQHLGERPRPCTASARSARRSRSPRLSSAARRPRRRTPSSAAPATIAIQTATLIVAMPPRRARGRSDVERRAENLRRHPSEHRDEHGERRAPSRRRRARAARSARPSRAETRARARRPRCAAGRGEQTPTSRTKQSAARPPIVASAAVTRNSDEPGARAELEPAAEQARGRSATR